MKDNPLDRVTNVTPNDLAPVLGVWPNVLREYLRDNFPQAAPGSGGRWVLTLLMVVKATQRFSEGRLNYNSK